MPRISTLDGWRGIAVLLVLLFHFELYFFHRFLNHPAAWCGEHGVTIFFVISGFLVTSNLFRNADLKRFYVRRFFRIMPAAWIYLAVVLILAQITTRIAIGNDLWGCLFFYRNYLAVGGPGNFTQHFWSLSMEEQFYLVWPLLLLTGRRMAALLALAGAISVAVYRAAHPFYMAQGYHSFFGTGLRIDAILVGCLLAFAVDNERTRLWIAAHSVVLFWLCAPVLAFDFWRYQSIPPLHECVAIGLMIAATVTNPHLIASRILEFSHLKTTGMLCYGIYLWQGLLFRQAFGRFGILLFPVAVLVSWVLIEKPSQRLGSRLLGAIEHSQLVPSVTGAEERSSAETVR